MANYRDFLNNYSDGLYTEDTGMNIDDLDNEDALADISENEDIDSTNIDVADLEDDDDDIDFIDDDDIDSLDLDIRKDTIDNSSDNEEENLSPEEEIAADDMMQVAATSLLVNDKLNDEEKKKFVESASEVQIVLNEGFMTESDIMELSDNIGVVQEKSYNKPMLIRLDAESKKKQLYALAVNISAAAHNDADYKKLRKVMKMRKILRARLFKKYRSEAMKRMKVYYARLRRSKSDTMNKISR